MADHDVDALSRKVDEIGRTLTEVDGRFADIDKHFAEQRRYIQFGLDTLRTELRTEMRAGFQAVDQRLEGMDRRLDRIEVKLDRFIDTQGGINRDLHSRTRALEEARRRRKG